MHKSNLLLATAFLAPMLTFQITSLLGQYPSASLLGLARFVTLSEGVAWRAALDTVHSGSLKGPSCLCFGWANLSMCSEGAQVLAAALTIVCTCVCVCMCVVCVGCVWDVCVGCVCVGCVCEVCVCMRVNLCFYWKRNYDSFCLFYPFCRKIYSIVDVTKRWLSFQHTEPAKIVCGVQSTNLSTGAVIWMCLFWLGKSSSVWSHGAHHGLVAWVPNGRASTTTELELWPAGERREEAKMG